MPSLAVSLFRKYLSSRVPVRSILSIQAFEINGSDYSTIDKVLIFFLVYLSRDKIGDQAVTVAVTPNGMADAVYKDKFVMPEERQMKFSSFLDILEKKENKQTQTVVPLQEEGVFYVQKQNSNLLSEFRDIIDDVETELVWASTALGMIIV